MKEAKVGKLRRGMGKDSGIECKACLAGAVAARFAMGRSIAEIPDLGGGGTRKQEKPAPSLMKSANPGLPDYSAHLGLASLPRRLSQSR